MKHRVTRGRIALALMALWIACRSCSPVRPPEPPTSPHLSVLTFNLDVDAPDKESALNTIEQSGADVVCVQEATPAWERALRERLGNRYRYVSFVHPANQYGGAGVLSRFPLGDEKWLPPAGGGWFPSQLVQVQTPLGKIQFLNVHLRPPSTNDGSKVLGYFTTGSVRREEIGQILSHLDSGLPAIVLGDFNEGDGGSAVSLVRARGLSDCLSQFDRHTATWHSRGGLIRLAERADHILYTPQLHCTGSKVIPQSSSDHDPVAADLGLARPQ